MGAPEPEPVEAPPDEALAARHLAEARKVNQRFVVVAGQKETDNAQVWPRTRARGERNVEPDMRQGAEVHIDPVEVHSGLILTGDLKAVVVIGDEDPIVRNTSLEGYRAGVQEGGVHEIDQVLEAQHPVGRPGHGLGEGRPPWVGELLGQRKRGWRVRAHPGPEIPSLFLDRVSDLDPGASGQGAGTSLRWHRHALTAGVEPPVVVPTLELAIDDIADREPGPPVGAVVRHQSRVALAVAPKNQVLAQGPNRYRVVTNQIGCSEHVPALSYPKQGIAHRPGRWSGPRGWHAGFPQGAHPCVLGQSPSETWVGHPHVNLHVVPQSLRGDRTTAHGTTAEDRGFCGEGRLVRAPVETASSSHLAARMATPQPSTPTRRGDICVKRIPVALHPASRDKPTP